jgi:hypothetical protein
VWRERVGSHCALLSGYGPTEATITATLQRIDGGDDAVVPLGAPIANVSVCVLDDALQPVPLGVAGELFLGGDGLARGYVGRAELTAERFVADPFSPEPGARLYRTGDLVRRDADGNLRFVGRVDAQVKLRGFRVEPGEVEAALAALDGVAEAAVRVIDAPGGAALVGYVVARDVPAIDAWSQALATKLPAYMLPAELVVLPALPRLPSGKLDRRALPLPTLVTPARTPTPPRTITEELVLTVWREVFGRSDLGIDDDFFALGGHSLVVVQVAARLKAALEVDVPLRLVFESRRAADLAAALESLLAAALDGLTDDEAAALTQS